mmetsp:Transcript_6645/g.7727  ORF Transcript_6645/g.7727 Transcript_6645/m.7727 type:complete len:173 (+) Transcript_6645:29-547(+)
MMFSTATRSTLLLCISLSAFVVNGVMAKKKKVDLVGQYFATYSYYETGYEVPVPGVMYQTFSTVDNFEGIYDWRECFCSVSSIDGSNSVGKSVGTATLYNDKKGDYRVDAGGLAYTGRKKNKNNKEVLQFTLQSFFNTGIFTALVQAKSTEEQLDDDACPEGGFATNCGFEE